MKSPRVVKKEVINTDEKENQREVNEENQPSGKGKNKKSAIKIEGDDELKGEKKPSTPVASPKIPRTKGMISVVTPQDDKKAAALSTKSSAKTNAKKAFGRKVLGDDFEDESTTRKAPVQVSPLVDIVYR